jgi:hypothetical protein
MMIMDVCTKLNTDWTISITPKRKPKLTSRDVIRTNYVTSFAIFYARFPMMLELSISSTHTHLPYQLPNIHFDPDHSEPSCCLGAGRIYSGSGRARCCSCIARWRPVPCGTPPEAGAWEGSRPSPTTCTFNTIWDPNASSLTPIKSHLYLNLFNYLTHV